MTFANGVGTATQYYGDETAASPTITAINGTARWGTNSVTITAGAARRADRDLGVGTDGRQSTPPLPTRWSPR